jgi:hypothetical protein
MIEELGGKYRLIDLFDNVAPETVYGRPKMIVRINPSNFGG